MAGRMGGKRVTIHNLQLLKVTLPPFVALLFPPFFTVYDVKLNDGTLLKRHESIIRSSSETALFAFILLRLLFLVFIIVD